MANPYIRRGLGLALTAAMPCAWAQTPVFINEIHYDNTGTDAGEAIEVAGPAGTDLTGWSIVLYNGSNGAVYDTDALPSPIPDAGNGVGFVTIDYPVNGIQNGAPDGIALVNNGTLVQFLCYEGSFVAVDGPAAGQGCTDIGVAESSGTPLDFSLQLGGSGSVAEDFTWQTEQADTFGAVNANQTLIAVDTPPSVSSTLPADGASDVLAGTTINVSFSEPVTLAPDALRLECAGTAVAGTLSGGPTAYSYDPDQDLPIGGECTATVAASGVTDLDGDPDPLAQDFVFRFTVLDPVAACQAPATQISAVQGETDTSPLLDQTVTVQGVVVGDFQEPVSPVNGVALGGYFIQEETADQDGSPLTSEGLFIASTTPVVVGDVVRVTGTVAELFGQTSLSNSTQPILCATGSAVAPTEVLLPFESDTFLERYEGMLVNLPQTLTATEVFTLARFGEVSVSSGERLFTPTHVAAPGTAANAVAADNDLNRLLIDDGQNGSNPDPLIYPQPDGLSAGNTLRVGSTVSGASGILSFGFGAYRLQPTQPLIFADANPRTAAPELPARGPQGGEVRVASFNVLNYFNTLDQPGSVCFPATDNSQCRGADTAEEFARQRAKTIAAIRGLDADIVGLIEMENDGFGPDSAIQDLVNGLNEDEGGGTWAFVDPFPGAEQPARQGGDAIKVAFIYRPAHAEPVGPAAILDNSVDIRAIDTQNRPPLAQTFRSLRTNDRFTAVVNHFKSKGSDCNVAEAPGELDDPDIGDEQGNCNLTRLSLAEAMIDWLATDPTGSGDPDFLVMGDLNAYRLEDPIQALVGAGYTDLITALNGDATYSFVFQGESGYLDHALANPALRPQVKAVTEWHINADEPVALDYNVEFKSEGQVASFYAPDAFRASDHDPVVLQMMSAGDLDNDGAVDRADRDVIVGALGARAGDERFVPEADYDDNGRITGSDLRRWLAFFRASRRI